eukprot:1689991-Pyramimonas_sp.AAC.1
MLSEVPADFLDRLGRLAAPLAPPQQGGVSSAESRHPRGPQKGYGLPTLSSSPKRGPGITDLVGGRPRVPQRVGYAPGVYDVRQVRQLQQQQR